jgi:hypothetical protein
MRLETLYTVRFIYPQGWEVVLDGPEGKEEQHFYFAEGRVDGGITGRFRAANHPRRRTDRTFLMDIKGFIEPDDGGLITLEYKGYGRPYPAGRRQVVGVATHLSDHEQYRRLNQVVCVIAGEVRVPNPPPVPLEQKDVTLVFSVSELIWEPPPD